MQAQSGMYKAVNVQGYYLQGIAGGQTLQDGLAPQAGRAGPQRPASAAPLRRLHQLLQQGALQLQLLAQLLQLRALFHQLRALFRLPLALLHLPLAQSRNLHPHVGNHIRHGPHGSTCKHHRREDQRQ